MGARWDDRGTEPDWLTREDNIDRQIIATQEGWVLRRNLIDAAGNPMQRDEVLVAIGDLSNTVGIPKLKELYVANSTGGTTLKTGDTLYVAAIWNEALVGGGANLSMAIANTVSGNAVVARPNSSIYLANNEVRFKFVPAVAGTYKVQAQTLANSSTWTLKATLRVENANGVITAAVSNALATFSVT